MCSAGLWPTVGAHQWSRDGPRDSGGPGPGPREVGQGGRGSLGTACGTWHVAPPLRDPQPQPSYGKEDASPGPEGPQEGHLGDDVHWRALGQEVETWARGAGLSPRVGSSGKSFSLSGLSSPFYKMSQLAPIDTFPDSMSWGPTSMGSPSLCKAEVAHEPLPIAGLLPASAGGTREGPQLRPVSIGKGG